MSCIIAAARGKTRRLASDTKEVPAGNPNVALAPGELTGSVWAKGGAMGGHRFGAVKARRLGNAELSCQSLKLSYSSMSDLTASSSSGSTKMTSIRVPRRV